MAEIVPTTINFEVSQSKDGNYEVKQVENEKPADLNSGSRQEFSFDVKVFSVWTLCLTPVERHTLTQI